MLGPSLHQDGHFAFMLGSLGSLLERFEYIGVDKRAENPNLKIGLAARRDLDFLGC